MSRLLLSLSLLSSLLSFVSTSNITPCEYDGMDFSSMNRAEGYEFRDSAWIYRWQICGIYTAESQCAAKSGAVCLYQATNPSSAVFFAAYDTAPAPVWSTTDNGAKLIYNNGASVAGKPANVNIDLQCGDAETPSTGTFDTTTGIINILQYTPLACKSEKTSLSGGWIFIIILLVSITLYVLIGCLYKFKRQGTRGVESCPNIDFWRELPRLVKDGCFFTFVKLRGLCGGSSHASMGAKSEYDNLK